MSQAYKKLFESVTLPNGTVLNNRFVMSSIVLQASTNDGKITSADLEYARRRSQSAALWITGVAYVEPFGHRFSKGFGVFNDSHISGLTVLAQTMKKDGSKAILQLVHSGRFAQTALKNYGIVYGPSPMRLNWPVEHQVIAMSQRKIDDVVRYFGDATRRAIQAGFDGIEISGGNYYLIQQFLSSATNKRTDHYGGSLSNRMRFGLEILRQVKSVIKEEGLAGFTVGFRISPEEVQGGRIGFTFDDTLSFIDNILEIGIDYLVTAAWGDYAYREVIRSGQYTGKLMNQVVNHHLHGRVPLIVNGGIKSAEMALEASSLGDLVGLATPFVADPEFAIKIKNGQKAMINLDIRGRETDLKLPHNAFNGIEYLFGVGNTLPKVTQKEILEM